MIQSATGPQEKLGALPIAGARWLRATCHTPAPSARRITTWAFVSSLSSTLNLQKLRESGFPVGNTDVLCGPGFPAKTGARGLKAVLPTPE